MFFDNLQKKLNKKEKAGDDMEFKQYVPEEEEIREEEEPKELPKAEEPKASKIKIMRPESFDEVSDIADSLLEGRTVVLNLEALEPKIMFKMLDFLNGVTYAVDGEIKPVTNTTFIVSPQSNVDISDI